MPRLPAALIISQGRLEPIGQTEHGTLSGRVGAASKSHRENEEAVTGLEIDLPGKSNIARFGPGPRPIHPAVPVQVLPAVRDTDVPTDRLRQSAEQASARAARSRSA